MMKATAKAPANIGFIKYWGKRDEELRLPLNSSISITLSNCFTITTVKFSKNFKRGSFKIVGEETTKKEKERVLKHLDRIRKKAGINFKARVLSQNSFPKKAGIASSASGFAALTVAASKAAGLKLSQKELSILARQGSGSACRSIPDGFVEWKAGSKNENSYSQSLYPPTYWNLRDLVVVVKDPIKKVGSTAAMKLSLKNPYFKKRLQQLPKRIKKIKKALTKKDFALLGEMIEEDAVDFHAIIMTSKPPIFYWNKVTMDIIHKVIELREEGIVESYFTIDAGPNVHLICQAKDALSLKKEIQKIKGVQKIIVNKPASGAHLINQHLF